MCDDDDDDDDDDDVDDENSLIFGTRNKPKVDFQSFSSAECTNHILTLSR